MTTRERAARENCYVCGLPMRPGQPCYWLKDADGLRFAAHKECAERGMEVVAKP